MDPGDGATGYSKCGEGSGSTCPQSVRAALEDGSEDNCLLKATKDLGIAFWWGEDLKLTLFADGDYAERCNDRRSVSGVAIMLGKTAVSANSTMQHCVTVSTSEAEYGVMAHGANTNLPIKTVLKFVQPHLSGRAIHMHEDNKGAKAMAKIYRVFTAAST